MERRGVPCHASGTRALAAVGVGLACNPENVIESVEPDEHAHRERTRQELHHPGRLAAAPGRAPLSAHPGTAGSDGGGGLGSGQRRPQRERRLPSGKRRLRQIDGRIRFSHETDRCRSCRGSGCAKKREGRDAGLLRRHGALRQRRRRRAGGEHRRRRRSRSGSPPYQLAVAAGAGFDEVRTGRPRGASRASRVGRLALSLRGALSAHRGSALHRTARSRVYPSASPRTRQ